MFLDGRELFTDLIVMEMQGYDVIIGMDWLSKSNATIGCKKKRVMFQPPKEEQFVYVGTSL